MRIIFSDTAWEDYLHWQSNNPKLFERINELIKDTRRNGNKGIGKPEPLRHALAGFWSRRINDEHRMVYQIAGDALILAQLRYHY